MSIEQSFEDFERVNPEDVLRGGEYLAWYKPNSLFFEVQVLRVIKVDSVASQVFIHWKNWSDKHDRYVPVDDLRKLTDQSQKEALALTLLENRTVAEELLNDEFRVRQEAENRRIRANARKARKVKWVWVEVTSDEDGDESDDEPHEKKQRMEKIGETQSKMPEHKKGDEGMIEDNERKEQKEAKKIDEMREEEKNAELNKEKDVPMGENKTEQEKDQVQEAVSPIVEDLSPDALAFLQKAWDEELPGNEVLRPHTSITRKEFLSLKGDKEKHGAPTLSSTLGSSRSRSSVSRTNNSPSIVSRKICGNLLGSNWLCDTVIDAYCGLLVDRGSTDAFPTVHAFNTFFYPKMRDHPVIASHWIRQVDLFHHDFLLIPVFRVKHWCLLVVDMTKKKIEYYDSMGWRDSERALGRTLEFLAKEAEKRGVHFDSTLWTLVVRSDIPLQGNNSDCGVFVCGYAEFATRRAPISFTQADMPVNRKKIAWKIGANSIDA